MTVGKEAIAAELERARHRMLDLLAGFDDATLTRQHSPLMSPLVWDMAHVGNYEDLWLVRALGAEGVGPQHDHLYDAFRHPRPTRPQLPLLSPAEARAYLTDVRARALDVLDRSVLDLDAPDRLLAGAFVYGMVIQHEHQHIETMLATCKLGALAAPQPSFTPCSPGEVVVPAGEYEIGTATHAWAYDNERPVHVVPVPAFAIDTSPVSNAQWHAFIADGGYDEPRWWSDDGWKWRQQEELVAPLFWDHDHAPDAPVMHVCWHEADAFARWAGRRLPTEHEWEAAARAGVLRATGQVWEWTSSDFTPWPGFSSFPYREYSEVFYGPDYKVLRGGSWASDAMVVRPTFRNWDYPIRRQIFSGVRTARDADPDASSPHRSEQSL